MPNIKLAVPPGVKSMAGQAGAENAYYASNLIRWKNGFVQRWNGWKRLFNSTTAGLVRAMHAFEGLDGLNYLLLGTDRGAQVYNGSSLYSFSQSSTSLLTVDWIGGTLTFTPTATSSSVVVHFPNHGAVVGQTFQTFLTFSIGGILLPPGVYTISGVLDPNNFVFQLPSPALTSTVCQNNTSGSARTFVVAGDGVPHPVRMQLRNHGLSVGSIVTMDLPVSFINGTSSSGPWYVLIGSQHTTTTPGDTYVNTVVTAVNSANEVAIAGIQVQATSSGGVDVNLSTEPSGFNAFTQQGNPSNTLISILPLTQTTIPQNWCVDNLGNIGLVCYSGSAIYTWSPPLPVTGSPALTNVSTGPEVNAGMFVTMPQAQIVAYGSEAVLGSGIQDPLLVRWSDAGSATTWTASITNQAGSFRLSRGSKIVGGLQGPSAAYLWTDTDVWLMSYIGTPLVNSFQLIGTGCGLISSKSCAVMGGQVIWMGQQAFWTLAAGGVQQVPCDVWDYVFGDIDSANSYKCHAAPNSDWSEITFYFPSLSGGTGEIDSYVQLNMQSGAWSQGLFVRTSWIDKSVFGGPLGSDPSLLVQQHETGFDADGQAMTGAYVETGYFALQDESDTIYLAAMEIPGWGWLGSNGYVRIYIKSMDYPNGRVQVHGPYQVTPTTRFFRPHVRGRLIAIRYEWGEALGYNARISFSRATVAANGKRP